MFPDFTSALTPIIPLLVLTLVFERALTSIYSTQAWEKFIGSPLRKLGIKDAKLYGAIIVNVLVAVGTGLDGVHMLAGVEMTFTGKLITGLFMSGGSKMWAELFNSLEKLRDGKLERMQADAEAVRARTAIDAKAVATNG